MRSDPVTALFADVFMLQSVLWAPTVPNVVWSLAYEMVFYLMLTALFLGGLHRRSSRYSLVFAAAAVGIGGVLVPGILSHRLLTPGVVVAIADSLLLVAVFVLVLLVCCGLTHRFIEAPMQRLGRRTAGWLDARFGPDVPAPRRPCPDPVVALASARYEAPVPGVRAP
jgi:peptidoglycan/LPS O-acetylase OafA/YrhL